MSSNINPSTINEAYPVSGINQSSQGFRSNFSAIKNNFITASSEISTLQSTQITVTGDVINNGTAPVLGNSTLSIPLVLSLKSIFDANTTLDTSSKNYNLTVDTTGRISGITSTDKTSYTGSSTPTITIVSNTPDVNNPTSTGIKSLSVPNFTIDEYGNITSVSYQDIDGFGLLGYNMPRNAIIVGNSLSESTFLNPPTDNTTQFVMSFTDGVITWEKFTISDSSVSNITAGNYISITGTDSLVVNFDATKISDSGTNIPSTSSFLVKNSDATLSSITQNNLKTLLGNMGFLTSIYLDKTPKLGGNLDLNGNNISSSGNLSISVSGTTKINGITYPNTLPTVDSSYLVYNKDGSTSFSTSSNMISITSTNGIKSTTSANGVGLSLDYTNMTVDNSLLANSEIVVLDTSVNQTKLVKMASFLAEYDNIAFVSSTNGNDSNDGSFNSPYKTIQKAITNHTNVILMPGTFSEDISISTSEVNLIAFKENTINFVGSISLAVQTTSVYFYGISFSLGSTDSYLLTTFSTNGDIFFKNCVFDGDNTSITSFLKLTGTLNSLIFNDCYFDAFIENNFVSGTLIIDGDYIQDNKLRFKQNGTSSSIIKNISKLLSVSHTSGNLTLENIDLIYDDTTTSLTNINGTSTNSTDKFVIKNCSTYNVFLDKFTVVTLTGNASYYFENFIRNDANNSYEYSIISYDKLYDDFYTINNLTISSPSYTLSDYRSFYRITNTMRSTITVLSPNTSYFGTNVVIKCYIKLIGSGNGSITLNNLVSTNGYDITFDGTSGNNIILEIMWDNDLNSWNCINRISLNSSGNIILSNVTENISASGTTISTATALTSKYNVITFATNNSGVLLPSLNIGTEIIILNRSGVDILIYPESNVSKIENLSYGTGQNMISGATARFVKTTNNLWRVV